MSTHQSSNMVIAERIKQIRLARGLSLDELAAAMGIITKQAISKYERGKAVPSPRVLTKLAQTLGVKAMHLVTEPFCRVEVVAYRKGASLKKKEQHRLESILKHGLEERCRLQRLTGHDYERPPISELGIRRLEDTEEAAHALRLRWKLGLEPIANLVATLEDRSVHVFEEKADEKFDGLSALAYGENGKIIAAGVLTRKVTAGERQRLNLSHELGHVVLKMPPSVDEEKAAFRFGGALLAPAEMLRREIGVRRTSIDLHELVLLKRRFGISLQALLYRMRDLEIISPSYYRRWCIDINRMGWRKQEPEELTRESPQWLCRQVLHANAEGLLSPEESERLLGEAVETKPPLSLIQRKAIMKLPIDERRKLLRAQAERLVKLYQEETEWKALETGDLVGS